MSNTEAVIVIKKKSKGHGGGHHGGAWKVAYADFVTAMMSFFLLLWLLNVTTDDQRRGIADYFDPANIARASGGIGQPLAGTSVSSDGQQSSPSSSFSLDVTLPGRPAPADDADFVDSGSTDEPTDATAEGSGYNLGELQAMLQGGMITEAQYMAAAAAVGARGLGETEREDDLPSGDRVAEAAQGDSGTVAEGTLDQAMDGAQLIDGTTPGTGIGGPEPSGQAGAADAPSEAELTAAMAEAEQLAFETAADELYQAMQALPELVDLVDHLVVDQTPEGLRIQIVDRDNQSMFPRGSANLYPDTRRIVELIAGVIAQMPNAISITGHTDATPFNHDGQYGNWELSADRAHAYRRALLAAGLPAGRLSHVVGKADTEPLTPEDPTAAPNRRISIVLLRGTSVTTSLESLLSP